MNTAAEAPMNSSSNTIVIITSDFLSECAALVGYKLVSERPCVFRVRPYKPADAIFWLAKNLHII